MVVKTDPELYPAGARRRGVDRFTNALRYYPRTVFELTTTRSWRRLFRRRARRSERTATLVALHTDGPIYHTDDDHLVVLRPIDSVSPSVVADPPANRTYYGSRSLATVLEADPATPPEPLDLSAHDLTVRDGLTRFRPVDRRSTDADSVRCQPVDGMATSAEGHC